MLSFFHVFCIILSVFVFPIYADMMKQIKHDQPVAGHVLALSAFAFSFVSIVLRNMH